MNEAELMYAITHGFIENEVQKFVTKETIRESGNDRDCAAARIYAWRKYVESVRDLPPPVAEKDIPL